jgi:SAM-dependent methyltransferase
VNDGVASVAPAATSAFDGAAASYDIGFTVTSLGRWLRETVWREIDASFSPGQLVLELGCGTGEDAVHLAARGVRVVATDASRAMLEQSAAKIRNRSLTDMVSFAPLDLNDTLSLESLADLIREHAQQGLVDGAFSNFGPINCVADRNALARALSRTIRPGGRIVLVGMSPICPWEIGYHLKHLRLKVAFRRLTAGRMAVVASGGTLPVWYPSVLRLRREFAPDFTTVSVRGLGVLLPASDMSALVGRFPRLFQAVRAVDRLVSRSRLSALVADHYILVMERRV